VLGWRGGDGGSLGEKRSTCPTFRYTAGMATIERERVRMSDFYVDQELAEVVQGLAAELGVSVAELCRSGLRMVVELTSYKAALAARMGTGGVPARLCTVCSMPRRPDPVSDGMAHAQCDTIVARLGEELAGV
jgi:hypothetical protein